MPVPPHTPEAPHTPVPPHTPQQVQALRLALLSWFDRHQRDLPWRHTRDPYAIWISEVMLQQTRVAAVLDHYARWMARFPTCAALAAADESEVLALWSGLGYYRRARSLLAGARAVVADHSGNLPHHAAALQQLPGIGDYTSAAIASIAFGQPVAVVDGNVERVAIRLDPTGTLAEAGPSSAPVKPRAVAQQVRATANTLLEPTRPGDWNQAIMELGATVCLPRRPLCLQCPVQPWCATRGEHLAPPPKTLTTRKIAYWLAQREHRGQGEVLLVQRPAAASLMSGMWELPECTPEECARACVQRPPSTREALLTLRHAITVTNYQVSIYSCDKCASAACASRPGSRWVPLHQLDQSALTGLARKALKRLALWPAPAPHPASLSTQGR